MYAHSVDGAGKQAWQPLAEHLRQVAELACRFASVFGAGEAAALAGRLHDLGKYSAAFQRRLDGGPMVDHATAGASHAMALKLSGWDAVMAQLVAHGIAGHHGGLDDRSALNDRLLKPIEPLDPAWRREIALEASGLMPKLTFDKPASGFQLAFLGRMVFSCLIDADRRDTAAFEARAKGLPVEADAWPALPQVIDRLIEAFEAELSRKPRDGAINALRHRILGAVRAKAALPPGLFTLTVPTGGGKTLASLGFALDHAKAQGLRRIIYAIPSLSRIRTGRPASARSNGFSRLRVSSMRRLAMMGESATFLAREIRMVLSISRTSTTQIRFITPHFCTASGVPGAKASPRYRARTFKKAAIYLILS